MLQIEVRGNPCFERDASPAMTNQLIFAADSQAAVDPNIFWFKAHKSWIRFPVRFFFFFLVPKLKEKDRILSPQNEIQYNEPKTKVSLPFHFILQMVDFKGKLFPI